jgi:hypothetical protein
VRLLLGEESTLLPCFETIDAPPLGTIAVMAVADADLLTSYPEKGAERGREWAATHRRSPEDARRVATAARVLVARDNQRILNICDVLS